MIVFGSTGIKYKLDSKLLSDGGEGKIYRVLGSKPKNVAKIYKDGVATRELEEKLVIMVNRPPSSKVLSQVAWPLDIIFDTYKKFCGFIMPELNINAELTEIYKYPLQMNISSQQKIIIAENICVVISEVHNAGYVFGDFNPRNIAVNKNNGKVAFLDTDTYHVEGSSKKIFYRCNVCAPGYSAPELLEKIASHINVYPNDKSHAYAKTPLPTFTKETDYFALAVHIFKLLMNGYTPYGGIKNTDTASLASPGTGDDAVRRDNHCFKPGYKHQSAAIPSITSFPKEITDFFTRAFLYGRSDPKQRPTAIEWYGALERYEKTLVTCIKNPLHQYEKRNASCPLCDADKRYNDLMSPAISQKTYGAVVTPPVIPVRPHKNIFTKVKNVNIKKLRKNYLSSVSGNLNQFFNQLSFKYILENLGKYLPKIFAVFIAVIVIYSAITDDMPFFNVLLIIGLAYVIFRFKIAGWILMIIIIITTLQFL